jgi:hypothetical protein
MGKATAVIPVATPETIWPSQITKNPLMPRGRRQDRLNFRIPVSISHRIRDGNPQDALFSCKVISNAAGFQKPE